MIIGTIFFIVGGIMAPKSFPVFYVLLGCGIFITTFGSIFFSIAICIIYSKRSVRMRQTIAQESMKYSSRLPIPCSWRLDMSRAVIGTYAYNNNNYQILYQVLFCFVYFYSNLVLFL